MKAPIAKLESSIDSLKEGLKDVKQKESNAEKAAAEITDQMKIIEQKADGSLISFISMQMNAQVFYHLYHLL